jgi:chaperonin GroES
VPEPAATNAESASPTPEPATSKPVTADPSRGNRDDKLAIKMLNDRVLVSVATNEGERTSSGGILIPATAQMSKRLAWAEVVAVGPNVRAMQPGDHVLFNPEDRYEVEVRGDDYIILRERDVHAVAASRLGEASTGLYL